MITAPFVRTTKFPSPRFQDLQTTLQTIVYLKGGKNLRTAMPIETAADLVQILANTAQRRGLDAHALTKRTGISEERLKLEIALIMDALGLDLGSL